MFGDNFGDAKMDDYEILNKLGSGVYGIVYRARNVHTNRIYALKKMKLKVCKNTNFISCI